MADSDSNNSSMEELAETDDFREQLLVLKAKWKAALKRNKKLLLKCPNYERCQSKCGSVGGMQYHYERCTGNAPRFKCEQCDRTYESRTGLNYHLASSHINEPTEESRTDGSSRPQRSAALNTMSAIHISNNPPSLKQSPHRTLPTTHKASPHKSSPNSHETTPTSHTPTKESATPKAQTKAAKTSLLPNLESVSLSPTKPSPIKKVAVTPTTPVPKVSGPKKTDGGGEGKGKKTAKYVTIPSIEYPDEYKSYLPTWRQEMKDNKVIKCPNYKECDFKCTTVNGMKYHFVRCKKANPPEFNCELCGKKFQCRTGLVWHLKKTHKLVDIQPSKGGGFKGTLPAKLRDQGFSQRIQQTSTDFTLGGMPRKKLKLSDVSRSGLENQSPGGHKTFKTYSRRKRFTPQKTPEEILQNVVMFRSLPLPKLGPQSIKLFIPLAEYSVIEYVPTDKAHVPSAVIQLGEEALSWQRMSSDSESEGDYQPEREFGEDTFGGYKSTNSLSDSDDDYMCSLNKKKGKSKPSVGGSGGRANAKRGRAAKNQEAKEQLFESGPLEDIKPSFTSESLPPPLLSRQDRDSNETIMGIPEVPALIKTPVDAPLESFAQSMFGHKKYSSPSDASHIQPPPGLIMPIKSEVPKSIGGNLNNTKLPEPPPLLKNDDSVDLFTSSSSGVYRHPHIVLPTDSSSQQSNTWTGNHSTTHTDHHSLSASGERAQKKLGRPPKSKAQQQGGKKSTTVRLGSTTAHFKPSKGTKGHTSSYSMKGMKMTRYEFQPSNSSAVSSEYNVRTETTSSPHAHTHHQGYTNTQSSSYASPAGSHIQNLVTPVQIFQGVPSTPVQMPTYQTVQPGSVVLMQGAHPLGMDFSPQQQLNPSYITQDGKTYQIVQAQSPHFSSPDPNDNSQKVSVIMQPPTGYTTNSGVGGIQYITQLDGPPGNTKEDASEKSKLRQQFEEVRSLEKAKLLELKSTTSNRDMSPTESTGTLQQSIASPSREPSTSGVGPMDTETSSENLMSKQLMMYFQKEKARKVKPPLTDDSPVNTSRLEKVKQNISSSPEAKKRSGARRQKNTSTASHSSSDRVSPDTDKSPRFTVSPNLFVCPTPSLQSSGNVHSARKTKSKIEAKDSKKSIVSPKPTNLFQPDNITQRQPLSTVIPSASPRAGAPMNVSTIPSNSNNSNSNDMSTTSSSSSLTSSPHETGTDDKDHAITVASVKSRLGKRSTRSRVKATSDDEAEIDAMPEMDADSSKSTSTTTVTSKRARPQTRGRGRGSKIARDTPSKEDNQGTSSLKKRSASKQKSKAQDTPSVQPAGSSKGNRGGRVKLGKRSREQEDTNTIDTDLTPSLDSPAEHVGKTKHVHGEKQQEAADTEQVTLKAKRGRPKKSKTEESLVDSNLSPPSSSVAVTNDDDTTSPDQTVLQDPLTPPTKKRGRQRKSVTTPSPVQTALQDPQTPPTKKRGRQRKSVTTPSPVQTALQDPQTPLAKKRGRPRKSATTPSEAIPSSTNSVPSVLTEPRGRPRGSTKNTKQFRCERCDIAYASKLGLEYHIDGTHPPVLDANASIQDCLPMWKKLFKKAKSVVCSKCESYRANSIVSMKYHWARCGKDEEDFILKCPHCDKDYKSEAGLKYHLRTNHKALPEPKEHTPPSLDVPTDPNQPLPARKAATKASKKLTELAHKETPLSLPIAMTREEHTKSPAVKPEVSDKRISVKKRNVALRELLAKDGFVDCPNEGCERRFTTMNGLQYHLNNHTKQKYSCPLCCQVLQGLKRFENHLKSKHPEQDVDLQHLDEYVPKEEGDESEPELLDDWEAEKDEKMNSEEPEEEDSKPSKRSTPTKGSGKFPTTNWMHGAPRHYGEYRQKVREIRNGLYGQNKQSALDGEDWQVKVQHWKKVQDSDLQPYLPEQSFSLPFTVQSKGVESVGVANQVVPLFDASEVRGGLKGSMLFCGGPVWCMDWLPVSEDNIENYVALSAYKRVDETFQMKTAFSQNGLIQIWQVANLTNDQGSTPNVQFALGVTHNYGVVRDMKWCPSVIDSRRSEEVGRLGVLALACSDGTVRILAPPKPEVLTQQLSPKAGKKKFSSKGKSKATLSSSDRVFVSLEEEAAILVSPGFGISDWSKFGQCLCLDWLPSNKFSRIAAGFSCGLVCVWNLDTSPSTDSGGLVIHPVIQLSAHKAPCRTVTWCPHDHNYLFTGGYDKFGSVWDLRQPNAPIEKQEKGLVVNSVWPLLWCEVLLHCDVTVAAYVQCPVNCHSYLHPPAGNRVAKNILFCSAPITNINYCPWTDRIAAASFSGELCVCAFSSQFHVSMNSNKEKKFRDKRYEVLYMCHREPLAPPTTQLSTSTSENSILSKPKKQKISKEENSHSSTSPQATELPTDISTGPHTMSSLFNTNRLVFNACPQSEIVERHSTLSPDEVPLSAITKACWSPNENSYEWMLIGTNSGLVQLLHIPAPKHKPVTSSQSVCILNEQSSLIPNHLHS